MKYKNLLKPTATILLSFILLFIFSACSQNDGSSEIPDPPANSDESINMVSGDYQFVVNHDNTITITKYTGQDISIEIPGEIDGKKVTAIGHTPERIGAFEYCTTLTSVVIPEGVTEIQDNAFYYCTKLTSVVIPEGVTKILDNAFYSCHNLKEITIPASVTVIWHCAFADCPNLQSVYFEGDAPQTGNYLFDLTFPTIYYHEGSDGWTNPWYGRATEIY